MNEPGVLAALTDLNFDRSATPAVARFLYVVGIVLTYWAVEAARWLDR